MVPLIRRRGSQVSGAPPDGMGGQNGSLGHLAFGLQKQPVEVVPEEAAETLATCLTAVGEDTGTSVPCPADLLGLSCAQVGEP